MIVAFLDFLLDILRGEESGVDSTLTEAVEGNAEGPASLCEGFDDPDST